jgi:hypothetical protein
MARYAWHLTVLDGALHAALHDTERDSHAIGEVRQSVAEKGGWKTAPHWEDAL